MSIDHEAKRMLMRKSGVGSNQYAKKPGGTVTIPEGNQVPADRVRQMLSDAISNVGSGGGEVQTPEAMHPAKTLPAVPTMDQAAKGGQRQQGNKNKVRIPEKGKRKLQHPGM